MKKDERIKMAKEIRNNAIDTTLLNMKTNGDLEKETIDKMHKVMHTSIMKALGCEVAFGEFRLRHDSPLKGNVDQIVSSLLDSIEFRVPVLSDKEKETIQKLFEREYKAALKRQATDIAWGFAERDIKSIVENDDAE